MPSHKINDDRKGLLSIAAAQLASLGESQMRIAAELELSQATVSRLIKHAGERGWLEEKLPTFRKDAVPPDMLAKVEAEFFSDEELENRLRPALRDAFFMEVHSHGSGVFYSAAAQQVVDLLSRSKYVGLMWGQSVAELVRNMERPVGQLDARVRAAIHCIPLCGEPVFMMNLSRQQYSASLLAEEMESLFAGKSDAALPSLFGVPAYIGRRSLGRTASSSHGKHHREVLDFVRNIPGFREIFVDRSGRGASGLPLIDRVDTIITGLGIVTPHENGQHRGMFVEERLKQKDVTAAELAKHVWGDMGGLLIGKRTNGEEDPVVDALNEGWVGVRREHFEDLAKRARKDGAPGVIAIATGAPKARIVIEAARRGYINHVIVDSELATAIKSLNGQGKPTE